MSNVPSRIGGYPIEREVGRGGMGVVYLGRDPRLDRPVAIKVLPEAFAADPERLARFEREARLLASLHHPNIAGIYGLEDDGPLRFLALEYVEGETLAERLARGALPLNEALEVCRQVATALEAAHEAGIVHRDLKPGNIKLTPAGDVKVLDFGLAKSGAAEAVSGSDLTQSPTMTHAATAAGIILGTAAYMSPEQARGRSVDKRSDIWSFGCVLYECLTGRQAFAGETVSDMIARILQGEPEWHALPARTPGRIRDLLRRCLEKDARKRMRDIGDARIEIDEVLEKESSGSVAAATTARSRSRTRGIVVGVAIALASAAITALTLRLLTPAAPARTTRFVIGEPAGSKFPFDATSLAISPDGRQLAFVALDSSQTGHLWVRTLETLEARMLQGTSQASQPFWSPDGRRLGFFAGGKLRTIPADGGQVDVICDAPTPRGGTWNAAGDILLAPFAEGPIVRVPTRGGEPVAVLRPDTTRRQHGLRFPQFLPDGKHFLFSVVPSLAGRNLIGVGALGSTRTDSVLASAGGATFAAPGTIFYATATRMLAASFDLRGFRVSAENAALPDLPNPTFFSGGPYVSASREGTLAFETGFLVENRLVWFDLAAHEIGAVPAAPTISIAVAIAPDGRRAVLTVLDEELSTRLSLVDLERGVATPFGDEPGQNEAPVWSPDGRRITYFNSMGGGAQHLIVRSVAGDVPVERYLEHDDHFKNLDSWSPDGRYIVFERLDPETQHDIWLLPMEGDHTPRLWLRQPGDEAEARISPDGRWITYRSDQSGRSEIYVRSFPSAAQVYQVTTGGGSNSGWLRDGRLAYGTAKDPTTVLVATLQPGPELRLGPATVFAHVPADAQGIGAPEDLRRLLALMPAEKPPPSTITVILNWRGALAKR